MLRIYSLAVCILVLACNIFMSKAYPIRDQQAFNCFWSSHDEGQPKLVCIPNDFKLDEIDIMKMMN